ncbi:MAG: response regulator transcription factor [Clostridia bacterium]|jgi:two-component system response regulator CiaR|nr:response regulator transcription factor [Clostridia bacterium]
MKILIVEDDKILAKTIEQCISLKYDVDHAYDGEEGILYARQNIYDAIILDLMMPVMDGYETLSQLRGEKIFTPILILTAKDGLDDKLKGFRIGADDYLVKPFNREELIARIDALVRRTTGNYSENTVNFKDLVLDLNNRKISVKGKEILLQGKQFDVLEYLINSKNTIITKDQIFDKIWGFDSETSTNVIEVYTSGLRKELKKLGYDKYLKTIRGVRIYMVRVIRGFYYE